MEQALVHRTAIGLRSLEQLAAAVDGLRQALLAQHRALLVDQPQVTSDPLALGDEVPRIDLCAGRDRRQAAAERQVAWLAIVPNAAELDPGITDAPLVFPQQQIPRHLLGGIAIGFDARRLDAGIEQERQRERQHLRFAGAVIPA